MQSYSNFLAQISNTPRVILNSKSRVHGASFSDKQFVDLQYLHECPNENTALQLQYFTDYIASSLASSVKGKHGEAEGKVRSTRNSQFLNI